MTRKQCTTCGEMKDLAQFHRRNHYTRSGYRASCSACVAEYDRKRPKGAPRLDEVDLKRRVRARTSAALMRGLIQKEPCPCCRSLQVEAHHPTYEGPFAHLNVIWLCRQEHARRHGVRDWTRQLRLPLCQALDQA